MSLFYFIVEPGQPLVRIPLSAMDDLSQRKRVLSDYAEKRIRIAEVRTEDEESGAPQSLRAVLCLYFRFDEEGFLLSDREDPDWLESAFSKLVPSHFAEDQKVVPLAATRKKRDIEQKYKWKPTPQEIAAIEKAALGHPRATKNVVSSRVKAGPEAKVSYEVTNSYDEIRSGIEKIAWAAERLGESELLGLRQLIEDRKQSQYHPAIWQAVLIESEKALKILEARRTGSGEWFAVVDLMLWDETETEGNTIKSWHEKHPTREAALDAARRLTREHISDLKANTSFEARIIGALQWEGGDNGKQNGT